MSDDRRHGRARELLADYRASIDNIDAALIHMLAERFRCTKAVGVLKAEHGLPPADPAREAAADRAPARSWPRRRSLDPDFAEKFLNFIIREVIRHHEQIAAENGDDRSRSRQPDLTHQPTEQIQGERNVTENSSGPRGLQEASLLPRRRRRRAFAARRPLHRAIGSWNPLLPKDGERVEARRRPRQALDRPRRAADRPRRRASSTRPASPSARPAPTRPRRCRARRRRSASPRSRRRRTTPPRRSPPPPLPAEEAAS